MVELESLLIELSNVVRLASWLLLADDESLFEPVLAVAALFAGVSYGLIPFCNKVKLEESDKILYNESSELVESLFKESSKVEALVDSALNILDNTADCRVLVGEFAEVPVTIVPVESALEALAVVLWVVGTATV